MSLILGYLASVLIGVSLGLIGGGGSILTVPVLVYLFGVSARDATAYSLFVVGSTALVAAIGCLRRGEVDVRAGLGFAAPSVIGVYLMRRVLVPAVPNELVRIGGFLVTKDGAILGFFGLLMLGAGVSMLRSRATEDATAADRRPSPNWVRLGLQGFGIGLVTGALGAGGGFLIVPALVLFAGATMKRAIATSLLVIAINSLLGFVGDLQSGRPIAWDLVLAVTGIAIAGSFVGAALGTRISGARLKPAFGAFILVAGGLVLLGGLYPSAPDAPNRKRRSRSEFRTTDTDENAIAAAAKIGLKRPDIASGIMTTL